MNSHEILDSRYNLHHFKVFAHPYLCRAFKIVESYRGENKHSLFPVHWSEHLLSLGSFPQNGNFQFLLFSLIEVHDAQFWMFWFQSHECSFNSENHVKFHDWNKRSDNLACEQALHLGDIVKSTRARGTRDETRLRLRGAPRGFAARSRVRARLASLAQIGELALRLR